MEWAPAESKVLLKDLMSSHFELTDSCLPKNGNKKLKGKFIFLKNSRYLSTIRPIPTIIPSRRKLVKFWKKRGTDHRRLAHSQFPTFFTNFNSFSLLGDRKPNNFYFNEDLESIPTEAM